MIIVPHARYDVIVPESIRSYRAFVRCTYPCLAYNLEAEANVWLKKPKNALLLSQLRLKLQKTKICLHLLFSLLRLDRVVPCCRAMLACGVQFLCQRCTVTTHNIFSMRSNSDASDRRKGYDSNGDDDSDYDDECANEATPRRQRRRRNRTQCAWHCANMIYGKGDARLADAERHRDHDRPNISQH
jgi:hypothetical protein